MTISPLFCRPLAAFYDRPLVWLLPFLALGAAMAWRGGGGEPGPALAAALGLSLAVIPARLRGGRRWSRAAVLMLIPAALALGWGLTARSLIPPSDPHHLINYVEPDDRRGLVILGGYVREDSGGRPDQNYRLIIEARELIRPGPDGPLETTVVHGAARISLDGRRPSLRRGDYVRFPVTLRRLAGFKNPGGLNFEQYWAARGLWVGGFVKNPALVTSWPEAGRTGFWSDWRDQAEKFIRRQVPEPAAGLLAAQLIGRRGSVSQASEETYRALGLSHILSVSGLHLGVWYGLCFWLIRTVLRRLERFRQRGANLTAAALALIPALFYAALVGPASPVIRAAVMISAAVAALLAFKKRDPWNVLAAAAWLILLLEPYRLFTASFQLSFVATAAMLAVFVRRPGLETATDSRPEKPAPPRSFLENAALAALAGTLGTAPLVVWHFGRVPLIGIAANVLFTGLLSFFVLIPGLLSLAILPFSPDLAAWPLAWAGGVQEALMPLMEELAHLAGPGWLQPAPGPIFILAWYAAGWVWLRGPWPWGKRLGTAGLILLVGLLPGLTAGHGQRNLLRFTVLDVGQGSSIHLNLPDASQMMVDGGGGYRFDPGRQVITGYLLHQGVSRLDLAALTHPDQDHLKGLISLTRDFQPREVWTSPWPEDYSGLYRRFLRAAGSRRVNPARFHGGRSFGPAEVKIFWPPPDYQWPEKAPRRGWSNDHSLVMKISWGRAAFLITGDISPEVERTLAARYGDQLRADVLTGPHHGGRYSLTPEFLAAVRPGWVVFSSGRHNAFGLPHPEAIERARQAGAQVWRTDQQGAAVFEAGPGRDGEVRVELKPFR